MDIYLFKIAVKKLISNGKIDQVFELSDKHLKSNSLTYKLILLLKADFIENQTSKNKGTISTEDYGVKISSYNDRMLGIIDNLMVNELIRYPNREYSFEEANEVIQSQEIENDSLRNEISNLKEVINILKRDKHELYKRLKEVSSPNVSEIMQFKEDSKKLRQLQMEMKKRMKSSKELILNILERRGNRSNEHRYQFFGK